MIPFEVIALSPYAREMFARGRSGRPFRDREERLIELGTWQPNEWAELMALYSAPDLSRDSHSLTLLKSERRAVWLDQVLSRGPSLVARCGSKVVGHAGLVAYDGGLSHELILFVHREYRNAGIGGALLDAALQLAPREGIERIWLTAEHGDDRACALYRGRGFRVSADAEQPPSSATRGEEVWTLDLRDLSPADEPSGNADAASSAIAVRLRALRHALRLMMIPIVCALVVAVVSEDPRGRLLALVLAFASAAFGIVVNGREILLGAGRGR
jgi:ribosomal protein S18 acetylase RimI-like enzyme